LPPFDADRPEVGNGQGRDDGGAADHKVAHAPVGMALPHEGTVIWAIPQLMLLDEVDNQNKGFIEIRNDIEFMLQELGPNSSLEFITASHWQRLAPG
jgi:hypothetical protein